MTKMQLVTVDKLRMDEVGILERLSGFTLAQLMQGEGNGSTMVLMALAHLSERRVNPKAKPDRLQKMAGVEFIKHLHDNFTFETLDDYQSMSVAELKAECGERGLAKTGTKAQLVNRLTDHDETSGDGQDPTAAA